MATKNNVGLVPPMGVLIIDELDIVVPLIVAQKTIESFNFETPLES
jgi:hypothetical protein